MKRTVLVIDDSGIMLRHIKSMVEEEYEVYLAVSGRIGVSMVEKHNPDIVLLDYDMPQMNGGETFDAIRATKNGQNVPIVFLTGVDDKEVIVRILEKKPAEYIMKPPSKEKLLSVISSVLNERG